jgi:hypothetical protein
MRITSPRLSAAIRSYQEARQELTAALLAEQPGKVVIARHNAFVVVPGPNGAPALIAARHVRLKRSKPAPSPAE